MHKWFLGLGLLVWACDDAEPGSVIEADVGTRDGEVVMFDRGVDAAPRVDSGADAAVSDGGPVVDMAPDRGPVGCMTDEACADDDPCTADTCAEGTCERAPIAGCCVEDADCEGGVCLEMACVDPPPAGTVIISEFIADPSAVGDTAGEWVELHNRGETSVFLNGWTLEGGEGEAHEIAPAEPLELAAGGYIVLGRNADPAVNGGVEVGYRYAGVTLSNGGDRIGIRDPGGALHDAVVYDGDWPVNAGASTALSNDRLDPEQNDLPESWCAGVAPWAAGDRGTPGAANPNCPRVDATIDWCRLQSPVVIEADTGTEVVVFGRVFEAGITDRTDATDADPQLRAQAGFGPEDSDPREDVGWVWMDAEPNPGWDAAAAMPAEPNNDEYQSTYALPAPGVYDHAYRFSRDGGESWLYCDRDAGAGSDGTEDGYQVGNSGTIISGAGPCAEVACDDPPPGRCDGPFVRVPAIAPGICRVEGGEVSCAYADGEPEDCRLADDQVCVEGACVPAPPRPAAGELVFTEIMYDTNDPLGEAAAEWFELHNRTDGPLRLDGCTIGDAAGVEAIDALAVPAGAHLLFARNADPAVNGGLQPDATFRFSLNNGGDTLTLSCGEVVVDTVAYDDGGDFPDARGASIALDPAAPDNAGAHWCLGQGVYFEVADEPESAHRGTPGAANPPCPVVDVTVDFCRLQHPLEVRAPLGTEVEVFGRFFEAGLTDLTPQNDLAEGLLAQVGHGPEGVFPDDVDWVWTPAEQNPRWNGAEAVPPEPNNDEWQGRIFVRGQQPYSLAFRFSLDGGQTWLFCDRNAGPGSDGSQDGYQPANAGRIEPIGGPCDDVVCAEPPASDCDGDVAVRSGQDGRCEVLDGVAVCVYPVDREDCAAVGGRCAAGACVDVPVAPGPTELVITEIMYDPHGPLADADAEWFEVKNVADAPRNLDGCSIYDATGPVAIEGLLVLEPGGYALFAHNSDPATNGGLPRVDAEFGFALNNNGDSVGIACGGQIIDEVLYGPGFPVARQASLSLDPAAQDTLRNDDGANWCLGQAVYFAGASPDEAHRGSPGADNPPCPVPEPCGGPCVDPPAADCADPSTRRSFAAEGACVDDACRYMERLEPCAPDEACDAGVCVRDACADVACDTPPPADCADAETRRVYQPAGQCRVVGGAADCQYPFDLEPCPGEVCNGGACGPAGAPAPAAGEVIFTEIMYDPHFALADNSAEWFEIHNRTEGFRRLNGCVVTDTAGGRMLIPALELAPGEYAFFGNSDDPAVNGGLEPAGVFGFALGNGGDGLTLACADVVIDAVAYDDGALFPDAQGHSLSLDPDAFDPAANDDGANWCLGAPAYFQVPADRQQDNHGTPGAQNPSCVAPVEFGRLQFPRAIAAEANALVTVFGRVYQPGITDRSVGTDPSARLIAQVGYGPDGTIPDAGWTWFDAIPNAAYDGLAAGERDNDEYLFELRLPVEGSYDYAWRFTADAGRTWLYADAGDAGSSDGYALDDAGDLQVAGAVDPCAGVSCDTPPPPVCDGQTDRFIYPEMGRCVVVAGAAACEYPPIPQACGAEEVCREGVCGPPGPPPPAPGEVIITEIMYDPHFDLGDANGEWIEIHNRSDAPRTLTGCVLGDIGGGALVIPALEMAPGDFVFFAASADAQLNGGLEPFAVFDFPLTNSGDTVLLTCGEEIDRVAYDDGPQFPDARAHSISLDPGAFDAVANDDGANWCLARDAYYVDPDGPATNNHGTPGAANPACDVPVEFAALQFPLQIAGSFGQQAAFYGRVYHPGITDRSPNNDRSALLLAEFGYGPDGTDPSAEPDAWTWRRATPTPGWDGGAVGAPNNDEYEAHLLLPEPGRYDYAWRFSADAGRTWTLADGPPAGSTDGYQIANAGDLLVEGEAGARVENNGDIIFSELMIDPRDLDPAEAQWFELYNTRAEEVLLDGCRVQPDVGLSVDLGGLRIPANGYLILARSADEVTNGGLQPARTFDFPLTASGSLLLTCRFEIDRLAYDDGPEFPSSVGASRQLSVVRHDHTQNDEGGYWCEGDAEYAAQNRGTPAAANRDCGPLQAFTADEVQAYFSTRCDDCHTDGNSTQGLNLDDFARSTYGVPASTFPDLALIQPGDRDESFLYKKMSIELFDLPGNNGVIMPPAEPQFPSTIERLGMFIDNLPPAP